MPQQPLVRRATVAALSAALVVLACAPAAAGPVFSDSSMSTALFSSNPSYVSAGVSLTNTTVGGVLVTDTGVMTGQTSYAFVAGHLYSGFTYNPSASGAITSIDLSLGRSGAAYLNGTDTGLAGLTLRGLIEQSGRLYQYAGPLTPYLPYPTLTTLSASGLLAGDFGEWDPVTNAVDAASNPDFGGALMRFGFATRIGPGAPGLETDRNQLVTTADNFVLAVNTGSVPLPATAWLVLVALGALALQRRGA